MTKHAEVFYNKFSYLYPLVDVFLKPQKRFLFKHINNLHEGNLLEIGVGNGSHLHLYKKHHVTGIDTSEAMLKTAGQTKRENITLIKMDGKALLFKDSEFDYIILSHVIAVVDDPEQLLYEVFRVLKPRGQVFILNHFTPDNWFRHIDTAFDKISQALHFKSVFRISDITAIQKFILLKEVGFAPASYFKLLIYQRP